MTQNSSNLSTDLRGLSGLTIDAVSGVVDIVESLHYTISSPSELSETQQKPRTRGITGLVYRNIRTITDLVGSTVDAALSPLGPLLEEKDSSPGRETALAALNGAIGDHLLARNNPLAIPMQFRLNGRPVDNQALAAAVQQANGRLAILVHGAFMSDLQWNRDGHDHGAALARDLGIATLYLHYNAGRHISENGREFADLLETTVAQLPQPVELSIIAYSMGGLVTRSASLYGKESNHNWLKSLQKIIFLGTPHHGAPLEKGGNWINVLMDTNPYSAPFSRLGKMRSSGITDLRYGSLLDEDWQERDRFKYSRDQRKPVPLPRGVHCYAAAAAIGEEEQRPCDDLLGDGLVPISSALGHHNKADLDLQIPQSRQWLGRNMNHLDLLNQPQVYETLKNWMSNPG